MQRQEDGSDSLIRNTFIHRLHFLFIWEESLVHSNKLFTVPLANQC